LLLLLSLASPLTAQASDSALRAEQITADNRHLQIGGTDAVAGDGDWLLSNGTICASISDPSHSSYVSAGGGVLVDVGFCGRNDDQWLTLHDLLDLRKQNTLPCEEISAQKDADSASLRCVGRRNGIERTLTYVVDGVHANQLAIRLLLQRVAPGPGVRLYGTLILHPKAVLAPFAVSSRDVRRNTGFKLPDPDTQSTLAMLRAIERQDTIWLLGDTQLPPAISYAVQTGPAVRIDADGDRQSLPPFALNGTDFTVLGYFTAAPLFETGNPIGLPQLLTLPFADLAIGDRLQVTQYLTLSKRYDTLDFSEALYADAPLQKLPPLPDNVAFLLRDARGAPLTWLSPEQPRPSQLHLSGKAPFRAELYGADKELVATVRLDRPDDVAAPRTNKLRVTAAHPLRLLFFDAHDKPQSLFDGDYRPLRFGGEPRAASNVSNAVDLLGDDSDPPYLELPAGTYRVIATRGPLHEIHQQVLRISGAGETTLDIPPLRAAVSVADWLSADFHVHGGYSFDSTLTPRKRLRAFIAQSADVLVVSEHHRVVDPALWQAALPRDQPLHLVSGVELTSIANTATTPTTAGHSNVFPLESQPHHWLGHDLEQNDRHLGDIVAAVRKLPQPTIMQLNHPRNVVQKESEGNFLNHLDHGVTFDRRQPLESDRNRSLLAPRTDGMRDIDFDAIEVMNGQELVSFEANKLDWFALLNQGYVRTATGSSDSHGMNDLVALPRSFVAMKERRWDRDEFVSAVRAGRLFISTGPVIDLKVNGAGIGETVEGKKITLRLSVQAPEWIAADKAIVYINGRVAEQFAIRKNESYERDYDLSQDSYVVVEVRGAPGAEYRLIAPELRPLALTNPVFVDADSDGIWRAPGLLP
jgi:hypothetical protein